MIKFYKSTKNKVFELEDYEDGCWINMIKPNSKEIHEIATKFNIDPLSISYALDRDESSRIEIEDEYVTVLIDIPVDESDEQSNHYTTLPLGIILTNETIITIFDTECKILNHFIKGKVKNFSTNKKSRFLFQILKINAWYFLQYLRQIDKLTNEIEQEVYSSVKNKELLQLLQLEKSLIYFSTSLKGNEMVLKKVLKSNNIPKFEDDEDLLSDVIIDNKQALEMAQIYANILSRIMDAFSSIISNNQNSAMFILTAITLVMSVFTIISGIFGMNVLGIPFAVHPNGFFIILGISSILALLCGISMIILNKKMLIK